MLEASGLCAGYGRIPILNGVDLSIVQGEIVGVLGHNGMGKTTLIRAMMGFLPATAGSIRFAGQDVTRSAVHVRARLGLGYVPQGRQLFPQLSVLENLRYGALHGGVDQIDRVVSDFPTLGPLLDRPGGSLSGGEQQLVAIARCLCANPRMILLDEPTEGIQPSIVEQISEILARLARARTLTLVVVEQNLDFIAGLVERVLVLYRGSITRSLQPSQLDDPDVLDEFVGMSSRT